MDFSFGEFMFGLKIFTQNTKAMSKKFKELKVIEVPASGKANWLGGAFCHAFVYSKFKGNFLVKGYYEEVKEYIKKNYSHYFVNYTLFGYNGFRDIWDFWLDSVSLWEPDRKYSRRKNSHKWFVGDRSVGIELYFRRLPKRWIKEFDRF